MARTQRTEQATALETGWWAVYTRHQHEKTIAAMLSTKGFEVFLPLYETVRRWKDRSKILMMPLFPCYVFIRGGMSQKLQIVSTPGIHSILYNGDRVATIPDEEIDAIRVAAGGSLRVEPYPFLKSGDRVRVVRGALEGVEGVLVRKKNLCRLILSVQMLAQSVAVEIDAMDVEPAKTGDAVPLSPATRIMRGNLPYSLDGKSASSVLKSTCA